MTLDIKTTEKLAYNGDNRYVYQYIKTSDVELSSIDSKYILLAYVRGLIENATCEDAHTLEARTARALRLLPVALDGLLAKHPGQIETVLAHVDSANYFSRQKLFEQALEALGKAKSQAAGRFPEWEQRASLDMAATALQLGEPGKAADILAHYVDRPYLFADKSLFADVVHRYAEAELHSGNADVFMRLQWRLASSIRTVTRAQKLIIASRGVLPILTARNAEATPAAKLLIFPLCCASILGKLPLVGPWITRAVGFGYRALGFSSNRVGRDTLAMLSKGDGQGAKAEGRLPILVTRAMGGIGDILMMTAGLTELQARNPARPVHFAVPGQFKPLLKGLPGITVTDINERVFRRDDYSALYDLTTCPASRIEGLTAPDVKLSRIEIFGKAMGIKGPSGGDWKTYYHVTQEESDAAKRFVSSVGTNCRKRIGIQLHSDERYRDYPHFADLIRILSRKHSVFLFHNKPITGFELENVHPIDDRPLREALAIFSLCDVVICPDSSFLHVAGALGIPCVALFGPTSAEQRTKHYPSVDYIDASDTIRCVPCWRNEYSPCTLSGTKESQCMKAIRVEDILKMVESKLTNC
ncbi:glycosyl transferase family 9 [Pseudodesulfovibrio mercurii]|uniref:Glycosyl transferase family 9 n=1 Tax=Pseudodesulfovibrio mercurii TaxID=641491 RepID=F0JDY4_9BACT|nr:glycosyltransferase family 9 protein [Pseudodesulfovibrio mercurii]EGB13424.1 glycosyl transferase family 9 [Pseudodesulfovibrio mercurii]